eukprot:CAMPEP_0197188540 /NCGR_PEP_ID=MMETSP1423-20130617/17964_1 /TAXON_ID=476441 /ORGANISM="Pseudo-nitzschia heimii, Strain UNC1101" /LENGTH=692 /DNA_ID=CAMNT_0042640395 /DNA_START=219 /DNA_END=2297 /DNA_ORIENTATION=+
MSLAAQNNDSIKGNITGPFEPSIPGDSSSSPAVVTATANNPAIDSSDLERQETGTASGINVKIEPLDDLQSNEAQGVHHDGRNMNATAMHIEAKSLDGIAPQQLLWTQQIGTSMNATAISPLQPIPGLSQLGTNTNTNTIAPAMNVKIESSNNNALQQAPAAHGIRMNMQSNFVTTGFLPGQAQNVQATQQMNPLVKAQMAMTTPIVPTMARATHGAVPISQATPQNVQKLLGASMSKGMSHIAATNVVGATPGTVRSSNGGGGQLLQFPWKLHEMLHLAEKNGKTSIISWLPGGNGFKVHNKEKFCAEIMPGYFASQKYKTFQRSLNLWGFESVAKGPDRGACYHQYFVKGHPELCHNMTRVKIKGQSNPRTPAAAAAAAASAAKKAAMTAAITAGQQPQQAHSLAVPRQQTHQQPLNLFTMNHFLPSMPMGMPQLGMQVAATNPAIANANLMAAAAANPYALAMNNFVAMNTLQQMNPALAAASLQNPAMNAMLAAQVMAAAANNQQAQVAAIGQQQPPAPMAQRQGVVAPVPGPPFATPAMAPDPATMIAAGIAAPIGIVPQQQGRQQQSQQQQQQQEQQLGTTPSAQTPAAEAVSTRQVPVLGTNAPAVTTPLAASANANYAEFLSRKAAMERQQQLQNMLYTTNSQVAAPVNNATMIPTATPELSAPAPAPVNVPTPEVNPEGAVAV